MSSSSDTLRTDCSSGLFLSHGGSSPLVSAAMLPSEIGYMALHIEDSHLT